MGYKFNYEWTLKDSKFTKDKGTVFSCFACGGGSTMGYKLAGFDVLGCNEIDPKMIEAYRTNHKPRYSYLEPIQTFKLRKDLPKELYNLDILDGSPPCSSFSMAGNREKDWGKEKKFKEGQSEQVLDTLFFDFIDLAKELQPKIIVAENVKGLLMGKAKDYVGEIGKAFDKAGYHVDKWLLDSSKMGVPQRRERVFFIAIRKDLVDLIPGWTDMFNPMPKLDLDFNEKEITFSEVQEYGVKRIDLPISDHNYWQNSDKNGRGKTSKGNTFGFFYKALSNLVCATIDTSSRYSINQSKELLLDSEFSKIGSYPLDYNHLGNKPQYLIGMSVPPVMTAQISLRIYEQWLSKM